QEASTAGAMGPARRQITFERTDPPRPQPRAATRDGPRPRRGGDHRRRGVPAPSGPEDWPGLDRRLARFAASRCRDRCDAPRRHAGAGREAVSGWLVDTNVLSELRRPRASKRVQAFIAGQPLESLFISSVTLAEIRYGIELLDDPVRRADLTSWLANGVR